MTESQTKKHRPEDIDTCASIDLSDVMTASEGPCVCGYISAYYTRYIAAPRVQRCVVDVTNPDLTQVHRFRSVWEVARAYEESGYSETPPVICIRGPSGSGKTELLLRQTDDKSQPIATFYFDSVDSCTSEIRETDISQRDGQVASYIIDGVKYLLKGRPIKAEPGRPVLIAIDEVGGHIEFLHRLCSVRARIIDGLRELLPGMDVRIVVAGTGVGFTTLHRAGTDPSSYVIVEPDSSSSLWDAWSTVRPDMSTLDQQQAVHLQRVIPRNMTTRLCTLARALVTNARMSAVFYHLQTRFHIAPGSDSHLSSLCSQAMSKFVSLNALGGLLPAGTAVARALVRALFMQLRANHVTPVDFYSLIVIWGIATDLARPRTWSDDLPNWREVPEPKSLGLYYPAHGPRYRVDAACRAMLYFCCGLGFDWASADDLESSVVDFLCVCLITPTEPLEDAHLTFAASPSSSWLRPVDVMVRLQTWPRKTTCSNPGCTLQRCRLKFELLPGTLRHNDQRSLENIAVDVVKSLNIVADDESWTASHRIFVNAPEASFAQLMVVVHQESGNQLLLVRCKGTTASSSVHQLQEHDILAELGKMGHTDPLCVLAFELDSLQNSNSKKLGPMLAALSNEGKAGARLRAYLGVDEANDESDFDSAFIVSKALHESLTKVYAVLSASAGTFDSAALLPWLCACVDWIYDMFEEECNRDVPPCPVLSEPAASAAQTLVDQLKSHTLKFPAMASHFEPPTLTRTALEQIMCGSVTVLRVTGLPDRPGVMPHPTPTAILKRALENEIGVAYPTIHLFVYCHPDAPTSFSNPGHPVPEHTWLVHTSPAAATGPEPWPPTGLYPLFDRDPPSRVVTLVEPH